MRCMLEAGFSPLRLVILFALVSLLVLNNKIMAMCIEKGRGDECAMPSRFL